MLSLLLASALAVAEPADPPPGQELIACAEALLPELEAATAAGLETPGAPGLILATGNDHIDAGLARCFAAAPVSDTWRAFLLTHLFADAGLRTLTASVRAAGVTAQQMTHAEALPELRAFTYGQRHMLEFAERVRAPFARLGIPANLDAQLLFYVYDARVARITGRILRLPPHWPRPEAENSDADLPALPPHTDYPPDAQIVFDVGVDGVVGQCLILGAFWGADYNDRLCQAAQARHYAPATDAGGHPAPGVATIIFGIWSRR